MGKIAVKLANASNRLKKDDGEYFTPHEVHVVEETERIKDCVSMNLLNKQPGYKIKDDKPVPETVTEKPADQQKAKQN